MLRSAQELLQKSKERLEILHDAQLSGEVYLAEGIVLGVLGICGEMLSLCYVVTVLKSVSLECDVHTRHSRLRSSHEHLLRAVETSPEPTASMWWHLATSWLRIHALASKVDVSPATHIGANGNGNAHVVAYLDEDSMEKALEAASNALALAPGEVRTWHLLGLVLGKLERWSDAKEVLERGCDVGAEDEDDPATDGESIVTAKRKSSDKSRLLDGDVPEVTYDAPTIDGLPNSPVDEASHSALSPAAAFVLRLPSSGEPNPESNEQQAEHDPKLGFPLLPDASFDLEKHYFPPTPMDKFDHSLQVRMTLGAMVEQMDGAEGAVEYWVTVFGWISDGNKDSSSSFRFFFSFLFARLICDQNARPP